MRTPEQVKQARKDLEAMRNAKHLRDEFFRLERERLDQKYAIMNERQAFEDAAWNARMRKKELRFKTVTIIVVSLLAYAIIIITNIASK